MTTGQRVAVGLGLIGVFLISVALGGFLSRQLRGTAPPAVAVATTVPSSQPSAVTSVPPAPTSPSSATVVPSSTASATPTAPPTPASTPTITGTPTPAPTQIPSVLLDPPTAADFAADLQAAINSGDNAYLAARLHPAVNERYGANRCVNHLNQGQADPGLVWEVQGSIGPAPWTWTTDGLDTVIDDTWTVTVQQGGESEPRDLHFAPADGLWRWFTDCGKPA